MSAIPFARFPKFSPDEIADAWDKIFGPPDPHDIADMIMEYYLLDELPSLSLVSSPDVWRNMFWCNDCCMYLYGECEDGHWTTSQSM
jgi:hypothetical protein